MSAVVDEEEAGALTSTLRCFNCHEMTAWIGYCVHCGVALFPMESSSVPGVFYRKEPGEPWYVSGNGWPKITLFSRAFLDPDFHNKDKNDLLDWVSTWELRITVANGWAVYALSTVSPVHDSCIGRLVDSELSCMVPA